MKVRSFDTVDALFEELRCDNEAADAAVLPQQAALTVGDFIYREASGVAIYGEILDPHDYWTRRGVTPQTASSALDAEELAQYESERQNWAAPAMRNVRFARCFSALCPDGELGNVHVATVQAKITRETFESARALGWPALVSSEQIAVSLDVTHDTRSGKYGFDVLINGEPFLSIAAKWDSVEATHEAAAPLLGRIGQQLVEAGRELARMVARAKAETSSERAKN